MLFFQRLSERTRSDQDELLNTPFVVNAIQGTLDLPSYVAFLCEAYHHVKHTVPLLRATRDALPPHYPWLKKALDEYIEEEMGHEAWILSDIAHCGYDPDPVREGDPGISCEVMVAYAWDTVQRRDPLGFFGMVHTLEGTSVRGATEAAQALQVKLELPKDAVTYLTTHGSLDLDHVDFFEGLMNQIHEERCQHVILHSSKVFFRLYTDLFRRLPVRGATPPTHKMEAAR